MQFTFAACFTAALAVLASAQTPANTAQPPSGNPIGNPELGELIPAGQSYTITWAPDTGDLVTLLLLRGPSTNVIPILTIAQSIPNTGSYIWPLVPTTLEPDTTGYGIQLIVEGTGAYQYSPQCGVSNPFFAPGGSSSGVSSSSSPGASTSASSTVTLISAVTTSTSSASSFAIVPTGAVGTGGNFSVPVLSPTGSMSVPVTLQSTFANTASRSASGTGTGTGVAVATSTGGAANVAVNVGALVLGGLVGVWAF